MLGVLMAAGGSAGAALAMVAASTRKRPVDLLAAVLAPVAILTALAGGVLIFVPTFFR
jgi:hypothetical protein